MISYALELAKAIASEIILSANTDELEHLGFPVVKDIHPVKAALAGIHAGLVASSTDWNLVLPCDMPFVSAMLMLHLEKQIGDDVELVLPSHDGFIEPLCGFYKTSLAPVIVANFKAERYSPLDLISVCKSKIVEVDALLGFESDTIFRNINELKDLG